MRQIFVRTEKGVVTTYGDLYTGRKDSFGREVFENDRVSVEYKTEFGSNIITLASVEYNPECGGVHILPDGELTDVLDCDIVRIIRVIDEKTTEDKNIGK